MKFIKGTPIEVQRAILNYQQGFECENDNNTIKEYLKTKFDKIYDFCINAKNLSEESKFEFCLDFLSDAEDMLFEKEIKAELIQMYKDLQKHRENLEIRERSIVNYY